MITAKALYKHGRIEWIDPVPSDITNAELRISVIPLSDLKEMREIEPCSDETVTVHEQDLLQTATNGCKQVAISCTEQHIGSTGKHVASDDELYVDAAFFLSALEDDESEDAVWEKYLP